MSTLSVDTIQGKTTAGTVKLPAGSILQTISGTFTGTTSKSGTSFSDIDSSLNLSITPKYSTSKLLYTGNIMVGTQDDVTALIRILQNNVEIGSGASASNRTSAHTGLNYFYLTTLSGSGQYYETFPCTIHHLTDSAIGTTSAITVKPQIVNADVSGVSFYINRSMNDDDSVWVGRFVSTFTVQEISQ
jgi:hypothetical protein|tara:strand:- start:78 stop:641 length:564 start_codon:yes stop_codon:yes gene_type:complete